MRLQNISLAMVITLIVFIIGCNSLTESSINQKTTPPRPVITYEGNVIPVAQGSYGWNHVQADYPSPTIIAKNMEAVILKPGAKLKISFSDPPNDISVYQWIDDPFNFVKYNIENDTITVPEKEGLYIFEIKGLWKDGDSSYVLKVDIKNLPL
ncbi:hypothetical protein [Heliophilum fasciatum]|uniref:Uncharacterized protein n=1 Tax=Heliophilum fasciatum TaxID=35700 RepID=A0A4R2RDQ6_9FIRM|nr:hypothetical protein [Heliophilum fasciatum]MCW2279274.1 hypothetical protein [Heliophilum fasciatum]TCP60478.1 hypothetical protein EDD73_1366 [Heliophilum fasciatum]